MLEKRDELVRHANHALLAALRERPRVRAAREEEPPREVHVGLLQAAQLALAEAREDRGGEHRPLIRLQRRDERRELLRPQDVADLLGAAARPHRLRRVRAEPPSCLARSVEGADQELADVVDRARGELALYRLEELLDVAGADVLERLRRER